MTELAIVRHTDDPLTLDSIRKRWTDYPPSLDTPDGGRVVSPVGPEHLGLERGNFRFVQVERVNWQRPSLAYDLTSETYSLNATTFTATRVWTEWDQATKDAWVAAKKTEEVDAYLLHGPAFVSYEIAKRAGLVTTRQQFASFVRNNWPDPELP